MNKLHPMEQEVIILSALWQMVDEMVNYEIFEENKKAVDVALMFKSHTHKKFFSIILGDFLSQPQSQKTSMFYGLPRPDSNCRLSDKTYLFYARHVLENPQFGGDASLLIEVTDSFSLWLEEKPVLEKAWISAIEKELDMSVERIRYLKICGDIAKHNFSRLSVSVRRVCEIFKEHGEEIDEAEGYLVLPDFFEWYHTHLFSYHASHIAEYLNNLRWGIWQYLRTEFLRSYKEVKDQRVDLVTYKYDVPVSIQHPFVKDAYWELMNNVRLQPYFPKFQVANSFKLEI